MPAYSTYTLPGSPEAAPAAARAASRLRQHRPTSCADPLRCTCQQPPSLRLTRPQELQLVVVDVGPDMHGHLSEVGRNLFNLATARVSCVLLKATALCAVASVHCGQSARELQLRAVHNRQLCQSCSHTN